MPRNILIKKYAKHIGKDEEVVNEAIISFFTYFKGCMKSSSLPDIRLKGFGVFRPALSRLKQYLIGLENKKKKDLISPSEYERKKDLITNYLDNHEFKKSSS
jgi:hypothetical protein